MNRKMMTGEGRNRR